MGRPRKTTVDYFPHFVSTDSRTKFILEQNWGNDGYAFWFKLLELLGRSEGHYYDCSAVANVTYISALMKLDRDTVTDILNTLADLGNIDKILWEQHRVIWCQGFIDNLQDVYSKRKISVPKKPEFPDLVPTTPDAGRVDKGEYCTGQAGEAGKPKSKPKRTGCLNKDQQELFEKFYKVYPKKVDRATAERAWAKIAPDDAMTEKIIQAIYEAERHDSRFRERQYIPNPASWLNAKAYLNEYPQEGGYCGFNGDRGQATSSGAFRPSDFGQRGNHNAKTGEGTGNPLEKRTATDGNL